MGARIDITAAVETFRFARAELGSDEAAMAVVLSAYAHTSGGAIERRPKQLILQCVCERFDVAIDDMLGESVTSTVSRARRVAMWILHASGYSYREAGERVNRKRTDAIRACQSVDRHEELQAETAEVARMIAERLPAVKGAPVVWPRAAGASK
jgi:chromosomal replication initiation ATPase DnaA